jgi:formate hydrogenlyase transcriptional activator
MADAKALPNLQALSRSPSPAQTLPSEAVLDALKMMLIGASLNEVLTSVTRLIEAHSEGMLCSIFLLDEDGLHLQYGVAANLPQAYLAATDGICIGPDVGSCGAAAYLRQPVFVPDILSHPNWANFRSVVLQSGLRAAWSTPIMSQDGKVLGTFCMYYREVRHPGADDIQLIDYASRIAGIAIERDRSQAALTLAFEKIKANEQSLRLIVDAIPGFVCTLNAAGEVELLNRQVLEYFGKPTEELKNWATSDVVHPDDLTRVIDAWRRSVETGQPYVLESRQRRADGVYRWFQSRALPARDTEGRITGWYMLLTDIDDRKRAEEKLRQDEWELRQIVDTIAQLVIFLSPEGDPLFANRFTLDYTGLSLEELKAEGYRTRVFHPDDVERLREERQKALLRGIPFENEQRARRSDGQYRWFFIRYNALRDEQGRPIRWYAAGIDIEDRKQAEERTRQENFALREQIDQVFMLEEIVGSSPALKTVLSSIVKVAPTESTVLITGETGTGKELIARAIHKGSQRAGQAFITVNCASIPSSLIASELFGHEKGAFTGALQRRQGRFELAHSGTIFLDEIGELPHETQTALLRVLQERQFERVGGNRVLSTDVRVIAATNRDLAAAIASGTFRADLFYRLNVFPIHVPPLRNRKEDIPMLVEYFVKRYAEKARKQISKIDKNTLKLCQSYPWPGNIRELQNIVERSVILCTGDTFWIDEAWLSSQNAPRPESSRPLTQNLQNYEKELIEAALAESNGKVAGPNGAAAKLGIPRSTLDLKIKHLNIKKNTIR